MPTQKQKKTIRSLASKGRSVNSIKDELDLPKSTVYYYFRKEVGQKQKKNRPKIPEDYDFQGELCGIFAGDGSFQLTETGKYSTRIYLNLKENYWEILRDYLEERTGRKPYVSKYEEGNRVTLIYGFKAFYNLFKKNLDWENDKAFTVRLKDENSCSEEFLKGFLRGLIDTDGYKRPDHKRYVFCSISEDLRDNFSYALKELDIEHTCFLEEPREETHRTRHKLRITGSDVDRFQEVVQPRKPKRCY